ncbi:MAG TPA: deaminase [Candidatus Paceibacterota bacterium]|jgi:dCMP deaminase|nr:deaminase [Candidatus Paceibacterota bacterium]
MTEVLAWVPDTDPDVLRRMFRRKLAPGYARPSHLDTIAKQAIVIGERSTCMWYEVGAVIFSGNIVLSSGYNGAAAGDVDPRYAGCARVVDGKLQEGKGLCRGSHAELNAIGNLSAGTMGLTDLQMMVTLHPCYNCAKQIRNKGIKHLHYIWEYGREEGVTKYLQDGGVQVGRYTSQHLEEWISHNGYHSVGVNSTL